MIHSQPPNTTTIFETRFMAPRPIPYNSGGYGNCLLKRRTKPSKSKKGVTLSSTKSRSFELLFRIKEAKLVTRSG